MADNRLKTLGSQLEKAAEILGSFAFALPGQARLEAERSELSHLIREVLLPKLAGRGETVLAVLVGCTGSGKSSLLNGLAGTRLSAVGPVRPTTVNPLAWISAQSMERFKGWSGPRPLELSVSDDPLLDSLSVLDLPDDSTVVEWALPDAQLCIFVVSALRYADTAAWEAIEGVRRRGLPVLFVLNRLPRELSQRTAVLEDFARMLFENGLLLSQDPSVVFPITEHSTPSDVLTGDAMGAIRRELGLLADRGLRASVARQAAEGTLADAIARTEAVADEIDRSNAYVDLLRRKAEEVHRWHRDAAAAALEEGGLADLPSDATDDVLKTQLAAAIARLVSAAARDTAAAWNQDPTGQQLLEKEPSLWLADHETSSEAERLVEAWTAETASLAALTGKGMWWPPARKRFASAVVRAVLDPSQRPLRQETKADLEGLFGGGKERLLTAIGELLNRDRGRFRRFLALHQPRTGLADELRETLKGVLGAAGALYGE